MFRKTTMKNGYSVLIVFMAALLMWNHGRGWQQTPPITLSSPLQTHTECDTGSANNRDSFTLFLHSETIARQLMQYLCNDPVFARQFANVKAYWSGTDEQVIQFVGKGIADLAMVKENLVQAFDAEQTHGYREVASYQNYGAYLIALREKPLIDKEYLLGKRIGLIDYPTSRSGHIIPKAMLKRLGLNEGNIEIRYANSHTALRELLAKGEVDIISSYWGERDLEQFSANYVTPLQSGISGSKWYLKMAQDNIELYCAVQKRLVDLSKQQQTPYYNKLLIPALCDSQAVSVLVKENRYEG